MASCIVAGSIRHRWQHDLPEFATDRLKWIRRLNRHHEAQSRKRARARLGQAALTTLPRFPITAESLMVALGLRSFQMRAQTLRRAVLLQAPAAERARRF